ncbi:MAG: TlpA family protein disulfide reductase [Bacteroidetes bacterium]|nr:TlpA family protein disulfide reductase [Bacteroidota bacterium]
MKIFAILLLSIMTFTLQAQEIPSYNLEELQAEIYTDEDVTYIVNFWATWCAPCVKELPYFEALNEKYKEDDKVKVVLVSLDFTLDRLVQYAEKNKLKSDVVFFTEKKPNQWIPAFSEEWTGSIPATIILNGHKGVNDFYEQSFESMKEIEELLPK